MLTFVAVKFISIVPVYIWGGLGYEGLFEVCKYTRNSRYRPLNCLLAVLAMFSDNSLP